MRRKLFTKLNIILFSVIFLMFISTNNVKAKSTEEVTSVLEEVSEENIIDTEENLVLEEKIMKYDVRTGETTEVDMEELTQAAAKIRNKNASNSSSIESIAPSEEYVKYMNNIKPSYSVLSVDRNRVTDTSALPYSAVCRIMFTNPSSSTGKSLGSGALVAKGTVLTAAHCVFDKNNNDAMFADWIAEPAYNGGPYQNLNSSYHTVYYSSLWREKHNEQYDWALCVLNNPVGRIVGAVGAETYADDSSLKNLEVRTLRLPY